MTGGIAPTAGQVRVLGENPRRFRRRPRERIGYMPQQFVLYPDLTAQENVGFVASLFGMLWRRRRDRVREVLAARRPVGRAGGRASELSGGMQRRLDLACAWSTNPALLSWTSHGRYRSDAEKGRSGTSCTGCAPRVGPSSSPPSTSARPRNATRSR
jgi:ABC-type multidrug transport system ATPase subunit